MRVHFSHFSSGVLWNINTEQNHVLACFVFVMDFSKFYLSYYFFFKDQHILGLSFSQGGSMKVPEPAHEGLPVFYTEVSLAIEII